MSHIETFTSESAIVLLRNIYSEGKKFDEAIATIPEEFRKDFLTSMINIFIENPKSEFLNFSRLCLKIDQSIVKFQMALNAFSKIETILLTETYVGPNWQQIATECKRKFAYSVASNTAHSFNDTGFRVVALKIILEQIDSDKVNAELLYSLFLDPNADPKKESRRIKEIIRKLKKSLRQ